MKSSPALAALIAAGAALTLTACSSSGTAGSGATAASAGAGSATSAAGGGSAPTPARSTSAAAATNAAAGKKINVCTALPVATVSKITGVTFTTTKTSGAAGVVAGCEYGGGTNLLQVSVTFQFGQHELEDDIDALKQVGHAPTKVSGVGDEAYSEPDPKGNAGSAGASAFASYGARFGDTYIKIGGFPYVDAAQGKQIVELIHSKM